ncbi:hypothetical protein JT350_gp72 [Salmonella phage SAP012]|uniref:HTH cro/C1-type domain-containing protein n=1 Tax=Salmonella phage SAP012 TaxID=2742114 RepID=A0A6J4EGC1_9CAUD|nr:hypothetical protein JT350_gp72 [Salmonella phage SAP012]BCG45235.1 hypothetical protein [Salmonella phage SAP012]
MNNFDRNIESFKKELAKNIKEARKNRTVTQSVLATLSGSAQAVISRIENGHLTCVSLEKLLHIMAVLNMEMTVEIKGKTHCQETGIDIKVSHVSFPDYRKNK